MRQPVVSIVIIAHNDQTHIESAIQSARDQTLKEIEIICVDDGSTDDTLLRMKKHATDDGRVKVIKQNNEGLVSARYNGIKHANADYVLFLDSDDMLKPGAAEIALNSAVNEKADLVEFGVETFSNEQNPPLDSTQRFFDTYFSPSRQFPEESTGEALITACFRDKIITWNVWNKVYKKELLLKALQFYQGEWICIAEDMLITLMVLSYAKRYVRINDVLYCYQIGGGMTTDTAKLTSEAAIKNAALEYNNIYLAQKWRKMAGLSYQETDEGLKAFKELICDGVFGRMLLKCLPEKRNEYVNWIEKCNNKDHFIADLIETVFDRNTGKKEEAVVALKNTWVTTSKTETVKTVAMYYYRLYNGGIERVMACLSGILQEAGYNVVIITEQDPTEQDYSVASGTRRVVLETRSEGAKERYEKWIKILREEKIDAVIYHSWVDPNIMADSIAIRSSGIPFLVHTHLAADEPFRWPDHTWVKQEKVYALADVIVTLSEVDNAWWSALGFRTVKVPNPCTFDFKKIHRARLDTKDVLWVGRLEEVKQHEEAFAIAQLVHKEIPDFRLHILGKAEKEEKTNRIIKMLHETGMDEYIIYEGYLTDVSSYYEKASVFLSTSRVEGFPMTFLESKAYGIPMVAYQLTNVDFLRNPEGVFVVPQYDRTGAANYIVRLLNDSKLRLEMGEAAYKSIEKCYEKPLSVLWKEILSQCLEPGGMGSCNQRQDPLHTAISRVIESVELRTNNAREITPAEQKMLNDYGRVNHTLYEVVNSASWKVGRMITYIPRHLKTRVKSLLRRQPEKIV